MEGTLDRQTLLIFILKRKSTSLTALSELKNRISQNLASKFLLFKNIEGKLIQKKF